MEVIRKNCGKDHGNPRTSNLEETGRVLAAHRRREVHKAILETGGRDFSDPQVPVCFLRMDLPMAILGSPSSPLLLSLPQLPSTFGGGGGGKMSIFTQAKSVWATT